MVWRAGMCKQTKTKLHIVHIAKDAAQYCDWVPAVHIFTSSSCTPQVHESRIHMNMNEYSF